MSGPPPAVSVLIAQWGNTELTARAVSAVRRSDYAGPVEILVYDNASPDGPGPVALRDDVTIVPGDTNIGFGPAINALAEAATGELLLILNNDAIVAPAALRKLVEAMVGDARHPGVVTPQYRNFDGRVLEMGVYVGRAGDGWQLFHGTRPPESLERMRYPAHYGSAACLLVDRRLFTERGGFDAAFAPAYYEDTDLCAAAAAAGRPTIVEPSAVVYHYEGATAGKDVASGFKSYQLRHQTTFASRWRSWLNTLPPISGAAAIGHALAPGSGRRILWVSPHLPRPDREAGHARIMRMIEALQEAGNHVSLWAEHAHDAGRYGRMLEERDIAWFGRTRLKLELPDGDPRSLAELGEVLDLRIWDCVIVSFAEMAERVAPAVRSHCPEAALLVDNVDLHFLREERADALGLAANGATGKEWELGVYRAADGVITASTLESDILAEEIPTTPVHTFAVAAEAPTPIDRPPTGGSLLFLGNFSHQPNVDAVDWWVAELAAEVERLAGRPIRLRVVGSGSDTYRDVWPERYIDIAGWVEDLADEFTAARAFIAPLRFGAGTKGKISTALAHGLPTITTSIGAEGVTGSVLAALRIADEPAAVARHVTELMTDDGAWQESHTETAAAAEGEWRRQRALVEEFGDWVDRRVRFRL